MKKIDVTIIKRKVRGIWYWIPKAAILEFEEDFKKAEGDTPLERNRNFNIKYGRYKSDENDKVVPFAFKVKEGERKIPVEIEKALIDEITSILMTYYREGNKLDGYELISEGEATEVATQIIEDI